VQLNDVAILTAISGLTDRLSPEVGDELWRALPAIRVRLAPSARIVLHPVV